MDGNGAVTARKQHVVQIETQTHAYAEFSADETPTFRKITVQPSISRESESATASRSCPLSRDTKMLQIEKRGLNFPVLRVKTFDTLQSVKRAPRNNQQRLEFYCVKISPVFIEIHSI